MACGTCFSMAHKDMSMESWEAEIQDGLKSQVNGRKGKTRKILVGNEKIKNFIHCRPNKFYVDRIKSM